MQPLCKDCLRACHCESISRQFVKVTGKSRVLCLHFRLVLEFPTTGRVEKSQLSVSSVDAHRVGLYTSLRVVVAVSRYEK